MRVLVVGAGAMGRWFATSVASGDDAVSFADLDRAAAADAAEEVGGRTYEPDDAGDGDRFDLVAVAVPIPAAVDVIETYAPLAREAVCDVTGSMRDPIDAMREHAPDAERLSLHPLFAPARAPGSVAAVADAPGPVTDRLRERLETAGNDVFETTPAEHDRAMETVQAGAHTAVLAFALAADDVPERFHTPVSAGLSDLVDRVTEGEPRVYADIQSAFDGADEVADAAREIADADPEAFAAVYERLAESDGAADR